MQPPRSTVRDQRGRPVNAECPAALNDDLHLNVMMVHDREGGGGERGTGGEKRTLAGREKPVFRGWFVWLRAALLSPVPLN